MALQLDFTDTDKGLVVPNAYAKIERFHGDKNVVFFDVAIFSSAQARTDNKQPFHNIGFEVPYTDGMSIQMLYDYLKTLPEFAGATDII